ncbi:ferrochelatase [Legionella adelaidensis]|uniref:Ferrochelatase n=1 Tax=Legionella adelaidensis TaxID=45056 RepID=A0A0W0R683_9GAMM|nr:ferrochelatase [Legionella adelaidensis]KTC66562.1 ferrochelatase [Legionella adelaidensis]
MKNGLLLINLGTPDQPTPSAVRRYLREFLSDKRVIELPAFVRYSLLYLFILPFRPRLSAHAYSAIWTKEGSPLLVNSQKLLQKLKDNVNKETKVALGMCYGNPSLQSAINELADCDRITVLPLYPQYSSAATGASIEKLLSLISPNNFIPSLNIINNFFNHPAFIKIQAELIKPFLINSEFLLLSYHGIPEYQLLKKDCKQKCTMKCSTLSSLYATCYRAQSLQTSELLGETLGLNKDQYQTAFQSRLGKAQWIKPYTDKVLIQLSQQGIKNLTVAFPSFTADCLETLEEIGIRANQQWKSLGGENLYLVPCLNDNDNWVQAILEITQLK